MIAVWRCDERVVGSPSVTWPLAYHLLISSPRFLRPPLLSFSLCRDVEVFDRCGLLTPSTILAHGVYLTDDELRLLKVRHTSPPDHVGPLVWGKRFQRFESEQISHLLCVHSASTTMPLRCSIQPSSSERDLPPLSFTWVMCAGSWYGYRPLSAVELLLRWGPL